MWNSMTDQEGRPVGNAAGRRKETRRANRATSRVVKVTVLAIVAMVSVGGAQIISHRYVDTMRGLSEEIAAVADELSHMSHGSAFNSLTARQTVAELKALIQQYENTIVFAESPYEGEVLLGTTPPGDSTWLEMPVGTSYNGPLKEIRIRRTGSRANYLRINDIEITAVGPRGVQRHVFNRNGRVKLYRGGLFKLALPTPMKVMRVRININHESTGLEVTGVPLNPPAIGVPVMTQVITRMPPHRSEPRPVIVTEVPEIPNEVLLGTTPPGHSTWLETLCSNPYHRPIREIQIRRTGNLDSYLRINDIELTYMTPRGPRTKVFNKNARAKLYANGVFRLALPQPMMRITRIRVRIDHKSTGLEIYGVY